MLRRLAALLVLLTTVTSSTVAQAAFTRAALGDRIDEILNAEAFEGATWGVFIRDLDNGRVLYDRSADLPMIPASNMKLVSTAAALDALGPDYRYQTSLYLDGPIEYGTLIGRLVIRGAGDPTWAGRSSRRDLADVFRQWADSLYDAGVRNVLDTLKVSDDVIQNPDTYFVRGLRNALDERGIGLPGGVEVVTSGVSPAYQRMRRIATHTSPPLAAFVGLTNTDSNNTYAERILRTVASAIYPSPGPVRPSLRRRAADPLLERFGIDPVTFVVDDGSGLSRGNRLTPIGIVRLLEGMREHPDPATRDAFVRSLPLGGFTGTLDRRYRAGDARGNVRAKTGYIRGVRTLSGYVTTARNHTIAFSILCNGYRTRTSRVNRAQDEVVELLADYMGM
ncbi:D-alanyl-D-alanine carboxypeptidase/D-alanyl-D-alanine endopeptidase [Rubrivirga sp.]|uniref:D-alanyl-D-alanine carboxypeptidase/D-alanyl-D-alanine endopeptidase n=1 Tax=Rubrivirga sp. TaxID=1885344 RepID=UPI003C72BC29